MGKAPHRSIRRETPEHLALAVMLARFDLFRSYARLCEERAHEASDARSMMEWGEAAVQWQRLANSAAKEDRGEAAS